MGTIRYEPSSIKDDVERINTPKGPKPAGTPDDEAYFAQVLRGPEGADSIVTTHSCSQYPGGALESLSWPPDDRPGFLTLAPRDAAMVGLWRLIQNISWQTFDLDRIAESGDNVIHAQLSRWVGVRLDHPVWTNPDMPAGTALITSSGDATWDNQGFNAFLMKETRDVFGKGTILRYLGVFEVPLILTTWAAHKDQRRGLEARIAQVLAAERSDDRGGRRVVVPEYFGRQVRFQLTSIARPDTDATAIENRWELDVNVIAEMEHVELVRIPGYVDGVSGTVSTEVE